MTRAALAVKSTPLEKTLRRNEDAVTVGSTVEKLWNLNPLVKNNFMNNFLMEMNFSITLLKALEVDLTTKLMLLPPILTWAILGNSEMN